MARKKPLLVDKVAYEKALRRELHEIMVRQKSLMKDRALRNIDAMKLHKGTTLLENGSTSDFLRKKALVNSIVGERFQWEMNGTRLSMVTVAMARDFKESYIGWFYEFGTGVYYEPPKVGFSLPHPGDPNPYRAFGSGTTIVSRSRKDNDGLWTDMGGNKRRSVSQKGGKPLPAFNTPAYKWFDKAHKETVEAVKKEVEDVPNRVNITKFIEGRHIRLG